MAIAALTIDINARLAGIEGDMGKVSRIAEQSAARMSRAFDSAGTALRGVFFGVAGMGVGAALSGFSRMVTEALDAQDALSDLNKSTAISIELLAGLKGASASAGTDLDGVASAINKLSINIAKAPEKFAEIGITAKEPLEALKQLADVFASIEDPQQRAAVAAEAVGKSWSSLAPLLSDGGDALGELVGKFQETSGVTEESARAAADLNDKLDLLKSSISAIGIAAANSLVPILDAIVPALSDSAREAKRASQEFSPLAETMRALIVVGGNVAFVMRSVGTEIGGMAAQVAALSRLDFQGFSNIGAAMREDAASSRQAFDAWEKSIMTAGQKFGDYSNEGRGRAITPDKRAAPASSVISKFIGAAGAGGGGRGGSSSAKSVDDGAKLVASLRDQIRATQDLTEVEKLELAISDGRYKTATSANLAIAMGYAETLDAIKASRAEAENEIEAQRERIKLFADGVRVMESVRTPTESLNAELQRLLVLLDAEAISMETFGRAAAKAGEEMQRLESEGEKTGDVLEEFAKSAAQNMQTAFANFLFDPFAGGTENMLKTFGNMLRRMIAEAASADIMRRLFGDLSGKGGGGGDRGLIVPFFESIAKMIPSFDVGTPYVPRDMLAVVHQGERIIPSAQNRTGGQSISVVINMTAGAGGSDLRQAAGDVARRIGQTIAGASRYA